MHFALGCTSYIEDPGTPMGPRRYLVFIPLPLLAALSATVLVRTHDARAGDEKPSSTPWSSGPPPARLRLDVLLVNDPDFPPVTAADAEAILSAAEATLADKLAIQEVDFGVTGETSIAEFFASTAAQDAECRQRFDTFRVHPHGRQPRTVPKRDVLKFLQRWEVDELRAFFPEPQRAALGNYDAIYDAVMDTFTAKLKLIAGFTLANGKSLLAPESMEYRSYVRWICAMRFQDRADLVLTNAFVLYDLGSEPYPHSIFQKNKVGGASLLSNKRQAIGDRAMFGSTFSMVTELPFFREEGVETLSAREKLAVVGAFIVAHELGHAVFKLPDFYNHPPECLMTTKYETGYVSGYEDIKKHPGACAECQPWVEAKRHVFRARALGAAGRRLDAIEELKQAIRKTPKQIDGSYLLYIAGLTVDVAALYAEEKDLQQAKRWLKSALRVAPGDARGLALKEQLGRSN